MKGLRASASALGGGTVLQAGGNEASRPADRPLEKRPGSSLGKKEAAQAAGLPPFFAPQANPASAAQNRKQLRRIHTGLQPCNQFSPAFYARLGKHGFQMVLHGVRGHK
jgi:hypothetical protein